MGQIRAHGQICGARLADVKAWGDALIAEGLAAPVE